MASSRLYNLLLAAVKEEVSKYSESICSGQAEDYPTYREVVGYIRGLNNAVRLLEDIEKELH